MPGNGNPFGPTPRSTDFNTPSPYDSFLGGGSVGVVPGLRSGNRFHDAISRTNSPLNSSYVTPSVNSSTSLPPNSWSNRAPLPGTTQSGTQGFIAQGNGSRNASMSSLMNGMLGQGAPVATGAPTGYQYNSGIGTPSHPVSAAAMSGMYGAGSESGYSLVDAAGRPVNNATGGGVVGGQVTMDMLQRAAMRDAQEQQGAADRQWERNNNENEMFRRFLGTIRGDVTGAADRNAAGLDDNAGRYEGQGVEQRGAITDAANRAYNDTTGMIRGAERDLVDVNADIQGAYDRYDRSASSYRGAIDNFQDRGAQDASAAAYAIRSQFGQQRQMLESGLRPDGTLMTEGERIAGLAQLDMQVNQAVQAAIAPILSHYNDTVLNAEGSYASLLGASGQARFEGANTRINAAGMRGQLANLQNAAGNNLVGGIAQGVSAQQQMAQLGASLRAQGAAMRNAGMLQAVQLEMQGRGQLADMIRANPESVVSTFNTLMGIYSLQHAQSTNAGAGGYGRPHIPQGTPPQGGSQQQRQNPWRPDPRAGINPDFNARTPSSTSNPYRLDGTGTNLFRSDPYNPRLEGTTWNRDLPDSTPSAQFADASPFLDPRYNTVVSPSSQSFVNFDD